jgi:3-phenylpropionate/trans-cinnamate dioxygenase ferredoxin reductase subunit
VQGAFSVFCYKGDRMIGVESVNRAGDHVFGRRMLAAGRSITPAQAADMSFDLKQAMA